MKLTKNALKIIDWNGNKMYRLEIYTIECEEAKEINLFDELLHEGVTFLQLLKYVVKYNGEFIFPYELKYFKLQCDISISINNYYQTINIIDLK